MCITDELLSQLSCIEIHTLKWDSGFRGYLLPILLRIAAKEVRPQMVQELMQLMDKEQIHKFATHSNFESPYKVLHRSCLEWAVSNNDRNAVTKWYLETVDI